MNLCIPTRNPNRWWTPIIETTHLVMPPILENQHLSMRCNAGLLQNQGNCNILLSGGFTLEPGQSYQFGNYNELNTMIFEMQIAFLPATATSEPVIQRLEVVEIMSKITDSGFYIDQPTVNPV